MSIYTIREGREDERRGTSRKESKGKYEVIAVRTINASKNLQTLLHLRYLFRREFPLHNPQRLEFPDCTR